MRHFLCSLPLLAALLIPTSSLAQENVPLKAGAQFDISVPSGVALGAEIRPPYIPWAKIGLSGTYLLSPGIRANLLLDPVNFGIGPVANFDAGWQSSFSIPGVNNSPSATFSYYDLQGGIGLGSRSHFRFLLMVGMTYMQAMISGLNQSLTLSNGVFIGDGMFNGWVPNGKVGFNVLF